MGAGVCCQGREGLGSSEGGQWVKPCFSQDGQSIQPSQTLPSPGGLRNGELRPQSGPPLLASLTSSMNKNKDDFSQPVCRIMNTQRGKEDFLGPHSPSGGGRLQEYMRAGSPGVQELLLIWLRK